MQLQSRPTEIAAKLLIWNMHLEFRNIKILKEEKLLQQMKYIGVLESWGQWRKEGLLTTAPSRASREYIQDSPGDHG